MENPIPAPIVSGFSNFFSLIIQEHSGMPETAPLARRCDTLLYADYLLADAQTTLENAALAIKDGKIASLGERGEISREWQADKVLDLGDALLMPGLINAHTHAAMTFLRGKADDLPLLEWLEKTVFPVEKRLSAEIVELGSMLGHAEMLASGTVACIDMYIFEEAVFRAAQRTGIRCMGGEAVFAFPSAACPSWRAALDRTAELASEYGNSGRIRLAINPHSVYTTDAEILAACRKLALDLDLPLHIHLAESQAETENSLRMHGCRPLEWCERNALFDCRAILAHAVDLADSEIDRLAQYNVTVVHNPSSNMKLASGIAPVEKMLDRGVAVALGTDGAASNNALNMFSEMSRCALLHKAYSKNPAAMPARRVLEMATLGGARAFGGLSGKLAPGSVADCIALDLSRPHMRPMHQPLSQIVYAASGHECKMTMVDGEILYHEGQFNRFNYQDLLERTQDLAKFAQNKK